MSAIAHRPTLTVRQLDLQDYLAKLRHWTRDDAWKPGGARLQFQNPEYRIGDVHLNEGNIVRCKPLVGRPCFGIATAFLRYRDHTRYVKGRGVLNAGRCHDCKARTACQWVVEQRLRSHPALDSAWTEWLKAGGSPAFSMPNFERSYAYRCWGALGRELQSHPFASANDHHVIDAYEEADRIARQKDRERKARDRRRARRTGQLDEVDIAMLEQAASRRWIGFALALLHPACPKALERVPHKSLVEMLDVWLGREILRLQGARPNAPNIARWIVKTNRSNGSANHAALASRVSKDLKRIAKFEKVDWDGGMLLPRLDREQEFPSVCVEHPPTQGAPLETPSPEEPGLGLETQDKT